MVRVLSRGGLGTEEEGELLAVCRGHQRQRSHDRAHEARIGCQLIKGRHGGGWGSCWSAAFPATDTSPSRAVSSGL